MVHCLSHSLHRRNLWGGELYNVLEKIFTFRSCFETIFSRFFVLSAEPTCTSFLPFERTVPESRRLVFAFLGQKTKPVGGATKASNLPWRRPKAAANREAI